MRKHTPRGSTERLDISGLGVFSADNRPGAANDGPLILGYRDLLIEAQSY